MLIPKIAQRSRNAMFMYFIEQYCTYIFRCMVNLNLKFEISHSSAMSPGVTIQDFADGNPLTYYLPDQEYYLLLKYVLKLLRG